MRQYFNSIILVTLFILPVQATLLTQDERNNLEERLTDDDLLHSPWSMMVPSTTLSPTLNLESDLSQLILSLLKILFWILELTPPLVSWSFQLTDLICMLSMPYRQISHTRLSTI